MKMNKAINEQEQEQEQDSSNKTKTRNLPDLSECQACGFRIDSCAGGNVNTIQILYSEWRLVLVCKKCIYRIESSQICSYCFQETVDDFFACSQCKRCVHRNCFLNSKTVAPWSYYSCCSKEFSICVDCWVPKSILKRRGSLICGKDSTLCADLGSSKNSIVLNGGPRRKIVLGLMAKGMMDRKLMVAKPKALGLGAEKDVVGENIERYAVDDAQLASCLPKTMNSLPMISKNLHVANSSCFRIPKQQECVGALVLGGSDSGNLELEVSTNKLNETMCQSILNCLKEGVESCTSNVLLKSSGDETSNNFDKGKSDRYLLKYRKRKSSSKSVMDNASKVEKCNGKPDYCLLKYKRRNSSSKSVMGNESKVEMSDGKPDRYLLKYRKRKPRTKQGQNGSSFRNMTTIIKNRVKSLNLKCSYRIKAYVLLLFCHLP